ncbi:MAG: hypothetical protein ACKVU0_06660 [Saprospiraceae bacterium]
MKFSISGICLALAFLVSPACQSSESQGAVANSVAANINSNGDPKLQALLSIVFVSNEDIGEYLASATIEKGQIKIGDEVDGVGKDGKRFSFKVTRMDISHQPVEIAKVGDRPFLLLQTNGKASGFNESYYIVEKGGSFPGNATTAASTEANLNKAEFTANVNGKPWSGAGFFNSALFYTKGNPYLNTDKPVLVLAFKSIQSPDNRQLNIHVKGFVPKTGTIPLETLDVMLTGASSGKDTDSQVASNYNEGNATAGKTPFKVEITKWEMASADEAIISGKVSGTMHRLFARENDVLENGSFSNVRVKVFNEKY